MADLSAHQVPFVKATVVRARRPASAHPGDTALVLPDGRIEGFVGGVCAEATVRLQALRLLTSGESLLLRITPDVPPAPDGAEPDASAEPDEGALDVANPCLSGGELEIFLEPLRPTPTVLVHGGTPIAQALLALGPGLDYDLRGDGPEPPTPDEVAQAAAVVVASHGRDEEQLLTLAARAGVPYIALVASRRRGGAVLAGLDLTDEQRARIHTPAGLWIGARTPGEIAVSILAELVASRHAVQVPDGEASEASEAAGGVAPGAGASGTGASGRAVAGARPVTAVDPVCGMSVAVVLDTPSTDAGGARQWFCSPGCRDRYAQDPARYAEAS
ncbi:YHS domain-containing protein [Streptacidiphilus sp. PB12-B1b]|uniref:XdhC family protein n=1 Tax=Streptacidiphilus sp. PB12-B1b TaxID=2705012 RepID=UPI0015FDF7D5|nr:XdhC family protein [Streptacidiphilus sp. PB12-B1b]QMU77863.1 YHS domain-containing protein [Streptacidiphilus sp. PB12-B1b]